VRFDDSLTTVLSADATSGVGARSAWLQLVDLIGRGRAPADTDTLAMLEDLRAVVPVEVRIASARMLARARPPAALVALFAADDAAVGAPVLRAVVLSDGDWLALLPSLDTRARSVLRHRRDLPDAVVRGLASFGPADFILSHDAPEVEAEAEPAPVAPPVEPMPVFAPAPDTPLSATPFQALGDVAQGIPLVAEARRRAASAPASAPRFEIADLVARIDAFQRDRPAPAPPADTRDPDPTILFFEYETDAAGTIRWVEGVARAALVGVSLAVDGARGLARLDAIAAGALRCRQSFTDARLEIAGTSTAAGSWRLSGAPMFDAASGRFIGMRGLGRRPRRDEQAESRSPAADSLRQLVHELRTPANAIMGFAELIGTELLGPVPDPYRQRAKMIRGQAAALVAAIEDLDTAARIEGGALELRPAHIAVATLVERAIGDLQALAGLRGVTLDIAPIAPALAVATDDRAAERLVSRLFAAIVAAGQRGDVIRLAATSDGPHVVLTVHQPHVPGEGAGEGLFRLDAEAGDATEIPGAPLLGIGFTLRLARKLAGELGGELVHAPGLLTLRLPAVPDREMEQVAAI